MIKTLEVEATEKHPYEMLLSEFAKLGPIHEQLVNNWNISYPDTIETDGITLPSYVIYIELDNVIVSQLFISQRLAIPKDLRLKYNQILTLQIYSVCTLPEYRNVGLCQSMMVSIITLARQLQACLILIVDCDNDIAVNIYKKLGFDQIGIDTRRIPDGYIMELSYEENLLLFS
jgi:ribosomal protein S18 acetylase RimI-like enzyme